MEQDSNVQDMAAVKTLLGESSVLMAHQYGVQPVGAATRVLSDRKSCSMARPS